MSFPFDPRRGLIIVTTELWGPTGSAVFQLALDTGATSTAVSPGMLVAIGYDLALSPDRFQVTTGSGIEYVARIVVKRVVALGQERLSFPVLGHTLPPSTGVDGVLGLDFLRGLELSIDFRTGRIRVG